jgi:hypothetical protein
LRPPYHNCKTTKYRRQLWYSFLDPTWKFCSHKCMFEWCDKHDFIFEDGPLEAITDGKTKKTIYRKDIR